MNQTRTYIPVQSRRILVGMLSPKPEPRRYSPIVVANITVQGANEVSSYAEYHQYVPVIIIGQDYRRHGVRVCKGRKLPKVEGYEPVQISRKEAITVGTRVIEQYRQKQVRNKLQVIRVDSNTKIASKSRQVLDRYKDGILAEKLMKSIVNAKQVMI